MSNIYAYIRVSSKEQNEDRQMIAMTRLCIQRKNIFMDNQSGKNFERPQYQKMIRKLKKTTYFILKTLTILDATMRKF